MIDLEMMDDDEHDEFFEDADLDPDDFDFWDMYPEETEILELSSIGHFLSHHFNGFVIVAKKNYRAIIEERFGE